MAVINASKSSNNIEKYFTKLKDNWLLSTTEFQPHRNYVKNNVQNTNALL